MSHVLSRVADAQRETCARDLDVCPGCSVSSTTMHAPGAHPLRGLCGERGPTSAWGQDLTCTSCMRRFVSDPLVLLTDHGAGATAKQRREVLAEAQAVWARLYAAGQHGDLRAPGRAAVAAEVRGAA